SRDQMQAYFDRRYIAPNITVVVAGKFDWTAFVGEVERRCSQWNSGPVRRDHVRETNGSGKFQVLTKDKVSQEHDILVSPAPAADSPTRYAADTLALAIGDDSGSRLYWALVDPGLADSADTSFHDYEGTGSFYTSFSCEPGRAQKNLAVAHRVLAEARRDGITEEELRQAKSQTLSRRVRGSARPVGRMQ